MNGDPIVSCNPPRCAGRIMGVASLVLTQAAFAIGFDPLNVDGGLASVYAERSGLEASEPCNAPLLPQAVVSLPEAASRALCRDPKLGQAWAAARIQAARLGQARAGRLPSINASVSSTENHTSRSDNWDRSNKQNGRTDAAQIDLQWILFDFGARSAEVKRAEALLTSTTESFRAATLDVLFNVGRDYYAALSARTERDAARAAQSSARHILKAAQSKMASGASSIAEVLQAKTTYDRTALEVARSESRVREATGTLAIDMGVDPAMQFDIEESTAKNRSSAVMARGVTSLIADALHSHPRLLASRAQIDAAQENLTSIRASALPNVRLEAGHSGARRPVDTFDGSGAPMGSTRGNYVGLRLTIPLFEGFSSVYRIREANQQLASQRAELVDTEQQVTLGVWKSFEALERSAETIARTESLMHTAAQGFEATEARYRAGVSGIVDWLRAQDGLSDARREHAAALSEWYVARLALASSVGSLNLSQFESD